jgi:hypothetical protein
VKRRPELFALQLRPVGPPGRYDLATINLQDGRSFHDRFERDEVVSLALVAWVEFAERPE